MTIILLENAETRSQQTMMHVALAALQKAYPGRNWGVRAEGPHNICITESRLLSWGGGHHVMNIRAADWSTVLEFETLVKKLGGELLERARLTTARKDTGKPVEQLPEGFSERFNRNKPKTTRMKLVGPHGESIEEMLAKRDARFTKDGLIKI